MSLLTIKNLHLAIGKKPILNAIDLQLPAGKVLGLVGESGSGKSMTALSILGLLPHTATTQGSIVLNGESLLDKSEAALCAIRGRDIGMVFQEPMTALNPMLNIGTQVAETIRLHRRVSARQALAQAGEVLERVGLPPERALLERYPHQLSGGQRQRVAIAAAIALNPFLLIADEPTTALDVSTQAQILKLLRNLTRENGCGLVLVTHDLAVVAEYADQVAIMQSGRIVEAGETSSVFKQPTQRYTQKLIANSLLASRQAKATSALTPPLLEVSNIVRDYRRPARNLFARAEQHRAVNSVSLLIHPGENVGLVGESGCGKSTLLRTILGLESPQQGTIRISGSAFDGGFAPTQRDLRRQIQIVFQDPYGSFDPRWRIAQVVGEPFHLLDPQPDQHEQRRRVEEVLLQVGLTPEDADRYPHEFSGGQRQRIAIARALITRPALLILDEAVSALDVSIRGQILELLADLSRRLGLAYLFVSHDLAVVRAVTDRVYVMRRGEIVESGPTAKVFTAPEHPYTAALLAATPDLERALKNRLVNTSSASYVTVRAA